MYVTTKANNSWRDPNGCTRYLHATIDVGPAAPGAKRRPMRLAFVLDRSGSMAGDRLANVRQTTTKALDRLSKKDSFAIVVYDDRIDTLMPMTAVEPASRAVAAAVLEEVNARGMTDLCGGWLAGCKEVASELQADAINRCILLTDGLANQGKTDPERLAEHARNLRKRGVITSTFGVGEDFNESLLNTLATEGGGNYHYIQDAQAIERLIMLELAEGLQTVATHAQFKLDVPGVQQIRCLSGFAFEQSGHSIVVSLGSLVADQVIDLVFELKFDPGSDEAMAVWALTGNGVDDWDGNVPFSRYAPDERDIEIDRKVAELMQAQMRREAVNLNREGYFNEAKNYIAESVIAIDLFSDGDEDIRGFAAGLAEEAEELGMQMSSARRKDMDSGSLHVLKSRKADGMLRDRIPITPRKKPRMQLVGTNASTTAHLNEVRSQISPAYGAAFHDLKLTVGPPLAKRVGNVLTESDEWGLARKAEGAGRARLVLTEGRLADGWFSRWHARPRTAVVSSAAWEQLSSLRMQAWLAYEILLYAPHTFSDTYDILALAHAETRGCLFDFLGDRRDVEIMLQSASLCQHCRSGLKRQGIDPNQFDKPLDLVRSLAISPAA